MSVNIRLLALIGREKDPYNEANIKAIHTIYGGSCLMVPPITQFKGTLEIYMVHRKLTILKRCGLLLKLSSLGGTRPYLSKKSPW